MPRYEFTGGSSNKFWEISKEGSSVTTRWGRIGSEGQTKTKEFDDDAGAQKEYDKLIRQKTKKGYQLAEGGESPAAAAPSAPTSEAENPELEAALYDDPNDKEAAQVYGDWLEQQGDPRGSLISLHAKGMRAEAHELIDANKDHFYGDVAEYASYDDDEVAVWVEWDLGFIKTIKVHLTYDQYEDGLKGHELLQTILTHPSAKFVQEIRLGMMSHEGDNDYSQCIDALKAAGERRTMRRLFLGDFIFPDENEMSWSAIGSDPSPLLALYPNLEEMALQSGAMSVGTIDHAGLKTFKVHTGGLDKKSLKEVCDAKWPNLEHLDVWLGTEDYEGDCEIDDLQPIFDATNLPKVKHLGLMNSTFQDDIAQRLVGSKVLTQLEELDLSMGTMLDAGAQAIIDNADEFAHLAKLNVSENYLSEAVVEQLKGVCREVLATDQKDDDDPEYRYVSVGE